MSRGRPREFDKEAALKRATELFWRNGYRGVSLDDLTQAMEINKPSLYAAFGDKESLFLAAIDFYRESVTRPQFQRLMNCENLKDGFRAFFKEMVKVVTNKDCPGCMIACMLSQESCDSEAIQAKLAHSLNAADQGFTALLTQHKNELHPYIYPSAAAKLLTSMLHGMAIRARSGATAKELEVIAEGAIKIICK